MRRRLEAIGAPVPRYAEVTDPAELEAFAPLGRPMVLKTARGGYDGRGVVLARDLDEAREFAGRNLAEGIRFWWRNAWRCGGSWPRWWPGRRSARAPHGRSWRPCSATGYASR